MTCQLSTAATLRAHAEDLYRQHADAVSKGDAAKGRALWALFRDAEWAAYMAEREVEYAELCEKYPEFEG